MSRLVVVSNRAASMKDPARAGGLAVALLDALRRSGGVWFGWSGAISEAERRTPSIQRHKALTVAALDLTPGEYDDYCNGFAEAVAAVPLPPRPRDLRPRALPGLPQGQPALRPGRRGRAPDRARHAAGGAQGVVEEAGRRRAARRRHGMAWRESFLERLYAMR